LEFFAGFFSKKRLLFVVLENGNRSKQFAIKLRICSIFLKAQKSAKSG
jgi:hypothetical protein